MVFNYKPGNLEPLDLIKKKRQTFYCKLCINVFIKNNCAVLFAARNTMNFFHFKVFIVLFHLFYSEISDYIYSRKFYKDRKFYLRI